jgi:hypothetical protein
VFEALDVNELELSRLAYNLDYYWRVDEVNAPANPGTYTGRTWSFKTEPEGIALAVDSIIDATGYSPEVVNPGQEPNMTCDGSGLDVNDTHSTAVDTMWLGYSLDPADPPWIKYEFDKVTNSSNFLYGTTMKAIQASIMALKMSI